METPASNELLRLLNFVTINCDPINSYYYQAKRKVQCAIEKRSYSEHPTNASLQLFICGRLMTSWCKFRFLYDTGHRQSIRHSMKKLAQNSFHTLNSLQIWFLSKDFCRKGATEAADKKNDKFHCIQERASNCKQNYRQSKTLSKLPKLIRKMVSPLKLYCEREDPIDIKGILIRACTH